MKPYIVCYLILLVCVGASLAWGRARTAAVIAFAPMMYLITARGLVGVDSAFYVQQFDVIRYQGFLAGGFEPGFAIIVEVLTYVFADSFDILVILGSVAALLILAAALMLEREPVLFLSLVLPFFLFDMTMNGLRYGLAFSIIAFGAAALIAGRRWLFLACVVGAATIQITSVLLAVGVWTLVEVRPRTFLAIALLGAGMLYQFGGYLGDKAAQNADLAAAGGLSGVVPLLVTFLMLVAIGLASGDRWRSVAVPVLGLGLLQLTAFGVSRVYYAGLRVQSIVVFMSYLVFAILVSRNHIDLRRNKLVAAILIFVCIVSSALRLKNFNDEQGVGLSPFAPYYYASDVIA